MKIKNNFDPIHKRNSFIFLYKLTKNIIKILFVFSLFLFLFYLLGNYQNFLDKSQLLILQILSITSIITGVLSIFGFLENLIFIFVEDNKLHIFFSMIYMIIIIVVCSFFVVYSTTLKQLALGI